LIVAPKI